MALNLLSDKRDSVSTTRGFESPVDVPMGVKVTEVLTGQPRPVPPWGDLIESVNQRNNEAMSSERKVKGATEERPVGPDSQKEAVHPGHWFYLKTYKRKGD
ncbi:hypothetical protein EYF80_019638 [Liparis tanakae]|uniref:Uncharacterized protein n=1 Tax=Liparis tanakae TaxID=230148 RepID=A0A4Z2HWT2_9TELE|nr:hypothetical protein EYF80_019638 [Liparis tanakae]